MASKSLGTLTLDVVAKVGGFVQGMTKAERASAKWRKQVKKDVDQISESLKKGAVAAAAAATAAAAGIAALTAKGLESIGAQADLARSLNTTFDSVTALQLAFSDAGIDGFERSLSRLNRRLGAAELGRGSAVKAVKELGLNLKELSQLDADERIATIADQIKNLSANSQQAARYAQDLGFEQREAAGFFAQGGDAIRAYQDEVKALGLSISEIDAEKVGIASDKFARFGLITQALSQQLAVNFANVLSAVSDEFIGAAKEAGGLEKVVSTGSRTMVSALAFVIDAGDSVGRVFSIAANNVVGLVAEAKKMELQILKLNMQLNPSRLFSDAINDKIREMGEEIEVLGAVADSAREAIRDALEKPLAGEGLLEAYDRAQAAGNAAAAAAVEASKETKGFGSAIVEAQEELEKIRVTSKKIETEPAFQKVLDNLDAYSKLLLDLRTDEEKLTDQLKERFDIMNAIKGLSDEERSKVGTRILDAAFGDAPQFAGVDAAVGGPAGELLKLDKATQDLDEWYKDSLDRLDQYRQQKLATDAAYDEQERELTKEHQEALANIEKQRQLVSLASTEELFGNLADITRQFAGEQSGILKALFLVQKGAAIAQSLVAIQAGIAQAAANPWPANLAAMASVAAATASIIGNIQAVSIAGMAHDGMDSIPQTGTWLLEKGERVTTADTSAKLDRTLSDVQNNMQEGGGMGQQDIRIVNAFDTEIIKDYMGSSTGEKVIMNAVRKNSKTIKSLANV
jgi:hypothetical protein